MEPIYFPVMKAMAGEFTALENMKAHTVSQIVPLFDFPLIPEKNKAYRESLTPIDLFIKTTCNSIKQVWAGRYAMFDIFHWNPTTTSESGEHIASAIYNTLKSLGVNVVPVVGYDRWEVQEYKHSLKSIAGSHSGRFCIRLDHHAFEDTADPDYLLDTLEDIIESLEISPANCHILLDFEDVSVLPLVDLLEKFDSMINLISRYEFSSYSIAGCSLPKTINLAVKDINSCGTVLRKEMLLWQDIRRQYPRLSIYFGDYAVRGPGSNSGIKNPNTNGKIRYTIPNAHFIARGHKMTLPPKGEQHWVLAQNIINSGYYLGPDFSWGDNKIMQCRNKEFSGGAPTWIKIDTNHHLAFVVSEVTEFERVLATQNANTVRI